MAESSFSPTAEVAAVSEVGLNVVVDLHSSASAVLNENSIGSTGGVFGPVDLQCPVTPQINLKLSELVSGSSSSDDEAAIVASVLETGAEGSLNTASPPPNCAICLGRCKNKCFTDSCMHQFCFKCLCEWSKIKPECPLCKQIFKSIIHNVKSIDQFEEYHVLTPPTLPTERNDVRNFERNLRPLVVDFNQGDRNWEAVDVSLNHLPRGRLGRTSGRTNFFPLSSTAIDTGTASTVSIASSFSGNANVQNQFVHRGELLEMYRQEYPEGITNGGSFNGTLSQLWRRYVYDRKLYALPVCDITGRFRQCTGRFYRDNPAQIHRLMPWINRDITCLLRNTQHNITTVLERINELLTSTDIIKPLFRRRLQPILGTKTAHFIHELYNFARSPYDMIGYDRAVQYSPRNTEEVVIEFSLSSSSSADVHSSEEEEPLNVVDGTNDLEIAREVARSRTRRRHNMLAEARRAHEYRLHSGTPSNQSPMVNLLSFSVSTTTEGGEIPGVSTAAVTESTSRTVRDAQSAAINLSTHNRSSEVIIDLDDIDVDIDSNANASAAPIYVPPATAVSNVAPVRALLSPTITDNIELSSTTSSDECEFVLERKPPHLRTPELVSLNSESDSDVVFVSEDHNQVAIRQECQEESISRQELEPPKTDFQSAEANTEHGIEMEEYNVGASTSTGLRSSGRRRPQDSRDEEINKIRKPERRKRKLRSSKDDSFDSTSSGSEWVKESGDEEDEEVKRFLRSRKKACERKRATRRITRRSVRIKKRRSMEDDAHCGKKVAKMQGDSSTEKADDDNDDDDASSNYNLMRLKKKLKRIDLALKELHEDDNDDAMKREIISENESVGCASENVQHIYNTIDHGNEAAVSDQRCEPTDECEEGSNLTAYSDVPNLVYNEPTMNEQASSAHELPEQRSPNASDAKSFNSEACSSLRSSRSSMNTSTSTSLISDSSTTSESSSISNTSSSEDSEADAYLFRRSPVIREQQNDISNNSANHLETDALDALRFAEQQNDNSNNTNDSANNIETDALDLGATASSTRDTEEPPYADVSQEESLFY